MRYRDGGSDDCADIIDMLTMYPEAGGKRYGCSARSRLPTNAMRTGQAGERRGTRPSFALGALRPAPHLA